MGLKEEHIEGFPFNDIVTFEMLVKRYRQNSINFARRYIKDLHVCEDISQEAFAAVFVYKDRYNPNMSFKTWLFSIIHNKCVDYIRKNRSLQGVITEEEYLREDLLESVDTKILLDQEIMRLKPNYRAIIQMVEIEGMTIREAAKVLKISEVHARVLNFRAKKKLQSGLMRGGFEFE